MDWGVWDKAAWDPAEEDGKSVCIDTNDGVPHTTPLAVDLPICRRWLESLDHRSSPAFMAVMNRSYSWSVVPIPPGSLQTRK